MIDEIREWFSVFDIIGIFAGVFVMFWIWSNDYAPANLVYYSDQENTKMWAILTGLAWFYGAPGFFAYGVIAFTGPYLWKNRQRVKAPESHMPYSHAEEDDSFFAFDPGRFFDDEMPEGQPRKKPRKDQPGLEYHPAPKKYSTSAGKRIYQFSGVADHPAHTNAALALSTCCYEMMGKERGRLFLRQAAQDESLPAHIRKMYIHADQIASR
jgi:hypothetical protein